MTGLGVETVRVASVTLPHIGAWWREAHHVIPIGFVGAISWSVWLVRFTLSRLYHPVPDGYTTTTSVVIPSYREDPDILEECLDTWLAENPTEVIVGPDLEDTEVIERLDARAAMDSRLKVLPFAHRGKRSALGLGIRRASCDVLVLADSDTRWEPGLLAHVLAPFADPKVGGVGTRQNAYLARTSAWRRVADWLIDVAYLDYVRGPAPAGGGGLPVRADGGLPARRGAAGARAPGGRVLSRPALRRRRRRSPDLAPACPPLQESLP